MTQESVRYSLTIYKKVPLYYTILLNTVEINRQNMVSQHTPGNYREQFNYKRKISNWQR